MKRKLTIDRLNSYPVISEEEQLQIIGGDGFLDDFSWSKLVNGGKELISILFGGGDNNSTNNSQSTRNGVYNGSSTQTGGINLSLLNQHNTNPNAGTISIYGFDSIIITSPDGSRREITRADSVILGR